MGKCINSVTSTVSDIVFKAFLDQDTTADLVSFRATDRTLREFSVEKLDDRIPGTDDGVEHFRLIMRDNSTGVENPGNICIDAIVFRCLFCPEVQLQDSITNDKVSFPFW